MSEPTSVAEQAPTTNAPSAEVSAPTERGWIKLLLALAAFLLVPRFPPVAAILPIEQTMMLFVPALAACALVGWWAGGRPFLAIVWVALAVALNVQVPHTPDPFYNLVRGWSLLLAGAFGLVCLFSSTRPLFPRAMVALGMTLFLAIVMSRLGPMKGSQVSKTVGDEFARRNHAVLAVVDSVVASPPPEWKALMDKFPQLGDLPAQQRAALTVLSRAGVIVYPALLALQSLAALALAWTTYHRLGRARLGPPLAPLREFRFNDQLVWGLIVGLVIMLLPTLTTISGLGKNLLVFFGALYALRGFGVLSWFLAPGTLGVALGVGFVMLAAPVLGALVLLGFIMLGIAALALGLGDTWADWRSRARPTSL